MESGMKWQPDGFEPETLHTFPNNKFRYETMAYYFSCLVARFMISTKGKFFYNTYTMDDKIIVQIARIEDTHKVKINTHQLYEQYKRPSAHEGGCIIS